MTLSHIGPAGRARMVDVGDKPESVRTARAQGLIRMSHEAFEMVQRNSGPKGSVLSTSELAGTMGAKQTPGLIPLCHPVGLDHSEVTASLDPELPGVRIEASARATGRTGVEMEALTAVSIALLTVYDMVKAVGHDMEIGEIHLVEKTGGTKGSWPRPVETTSKQ